jgi:hypothetical protein
MVSWTLLRHAYANKFAPTELRDKFERGIIPFAFFLCALCDFAVIWLLASTFLQGERD